MFTIIVISTSISSVFISYLMSICFNIRLVWDTPLQRAPVVTHIDFTFHNGIVYPLMVSGFAIAIKMSKNFYRKQKENEQLLKQKINAEVLLLKGQIHPRFLFHSLHSINEDMLNGAHNSPQMILQLSDILSYILYESDDEFVSLDEELDMIKNYIDLEKISYGDQLLVRFENNIHNSKKLIAPLILLPVMEFAFEQNSNHNEQPTSIDLNTHLNGNKFSFNVTVRNNTPALNNLLKTSVQLQQVEKRLQAQYDNRNYFKIHANKDAITISLSLIFNN